MSTSECSCRYRSSLRTWSGGPGGTSCTGQYCYLASGQRNGFPESPATAIVAAMSAPALMDGPVRMTDAGATFATGAAARQHPIYHRIAGYRRTLARLRILADYPSETAQVTGTGRLTWPSAARRSPARFCQVPIGVRPADTIPAVP